MNFKIFQLLLVTFVAIFTSIVVLFLFTGIASLLVPISEGSITMVGGGVSNRFFNLLGAMLLLIILVIIIWNRRSF